MTIGPGNDTLMATYSPTNRADLLVPRTFILRVLPTLTILVADRDSEQLAQFG